jgi:hypothetical protein
MNTEKFALTAAKSAHWLPHRVNPVQRRMQFVPMTRDVYESSNFLDDRFLPANDQAQVIRFPDKSLACSPTTVDFIFHGAFCGSTLLSRCLDIPGSRLAIREPLILRQLFEIRRRHGSRFDDRRMQQLLQLVMHFLGTGFSPAERVLIKPSNLCNPFIEHLLELTRGRAILLSVGLEQFLISSLKKGPHSLAKHRWIMDGLLDEQALGRLPKRIKVRIKRVTDLEAAAVVWLLQTWQFDDLLQGRFRDRLKAVRFEDFLDHPISGLNGIINFLEQRPAHRRVDTDPLLYNAKATKERYGSHQRKLEARYVRKVFGRQIDAVMRWIDSDSCFPGSAASEDSGNQHSVRAS